ncbi:MAG: LysR family transcriptional regulator [Mesorhizobium sp.]|uniref:LysR family transcriptional regulator n=1 Tax=Mesorhizobium sp. TaxID=1871066 RepID=UPI001AD0437F|nr:LysR family transcriptional regulator [Mesorhizobium sp.]MBN9217301.1 LysR family transcriptional regulator [Mesorhizobium sp.]
MSARHADTVRLPWLNTLVAFEAASRLGSLTLAASELNLTPGAVSRQIKLLEQSLDVTLFQRSHNAIELTDAGRAFLGHVKNALAEIRKGAREVSGQAAKLTIRAPLTLTQRWLIPRLEHYHHDHPGVDLRFRTIGTAGSDRIDVEIKYARGSPPATEVEGEMFLADNTAPICRPELLSRLGILTDPIQVLSLPILQDTADAWSWRQWCKGAAIPFEPLGRSMVFDTDEAAIDACLSGLGVAQANTAFVDPLLRSGSITRLCPQIEVLLGAYYAVVHTSGRVADAFVAWLKSQGRGAELVK